ncbi:hypoxanthine phosphoribosyltransferase [Levilactobacillus bambusae]|uniref:Hypoxanthine phosphoribosyltransferase n=1 Tax=Levilactobacillus bambusae TaxID=2024736 RepID=A0A2V1MYP4_9LACO|nr:hypoxanthine phosphoribosyltransferase [Levilactobacillus bambusae]PWF99294.1 hypoxanthine phosphoribosyltransferase [Levilactobacillus bambusae]
MNNDIEKILYSVDDIHEAASRLGKQLADDYRDKNPMMVCVLKGAVLFMADVIREMPVYSTIDFVDVSSYNGGTESSGQVELVTDLSSDVQGRDIVLVEDIIDTGRTLAYLIDLLKDRGANSISVCTLLDKPSGRVVEAKADYVGFEVPNEFLVGYGLDYQGQYRNLPYIGILKPSVYLDK